MVRISFSFIFILAGPSYIRPNQSYLKKKEFVKKQMEHQHTTIIDCLTEKFRRQHQQKAMFSLLKEFSDELNVIFNQQRATSMTYQDIHRMKHDLKLLLSIKRKLKKLPLIIRQSDKSGVIHIGYKKDYDRKVLAYQEKTQAYIELSSNPLMETYEKVIQLLNELRNRKQIQPWQYNKMLPKREKMQLAYLYFIPKPHKVIEFFLFFLKLQDSFLFVSHSLIGRYTTSTNCFIDLCTNNRHF